LGINLYFYAPIKSFETMASAATSIQAYLETIPDDKRNAVEKLCSIFRKNLPKGFEEAMCYGMIGYVVPHSIYPKGYHCKPNQALPFINIAAQKNFIAVYHMGIYANPDLLQWFVDEFPKHTSAKLDMGKSCIRFKKPETIPYELFKQLAEKMSVVDWVTCYENSFVAKSK
jgi:uncharacterized protein YdhG (YjbR/CyaY superfamily)